MNYTDIINGCWELAGAFSIYLSIRGLLKDKKVNGVSWLTVFFFASWGVWNVFFYPVNGLIFSFIGGVVLSIMNIRWVVLLLKYRKNK